MDFEKIKSTIALMGMGFIIALILSKALAEYQTQPSKTQLEYFESLVRNPPEWVETSMTIDQFQFYYLTREELGPVAVIPILRKLCSKEAHNGII